MSEYKELARLQDIHDIRYLHIDEPWDDTASWVLDGIGTSLREISPAGQLHLKAGNAGGTDSTARAYRSNIFQQYLSSFTTEIKIKFDQLAGGYNGTTATLDCFLIGILTGVHVNYVLISDDSVWFYDSTNGYVQQFTASLDNVSWYTIRLIHFAKSIILFIKDDDGDWAYWGSCDDGDPNAGFPGLIQLIAQNYPASPAETEVHIDYFKIAAGEYYPIDWDI